MNALLLHKKNNRTEYIINIIMGVRKTWTWELWGKWGQGSSTAAVMPEKASLTGPQTWGISHKSASRIECWGRGAQAWGFKWRSCWACSRSCFGSQHDLPTEALSAGQASQAERQSPVKGEECRGRGYRHSQMTQVPTNCCGNLELLEIRVVLSSGIFQSKQCQGFTSNFTLYF